MSINHGDSIGFISQWTFTSLQNWSISIALLGNPGVERCQAVHLSNVGVAVSKTLFHDFWLGFPMFIWLENTVKFCLETSYDQRLEFSSIRLQIKAGAIGMDMCIFQITCACLQSNPGRGRYFQYVSIHPSIHLSIRNNTEKHKKQYIPLHSVVLQTVHALHTSSTRASRGRKFQNWDVYGL